ncbi:TPA: hypothetical protein N0F65_009765 [Lagenidium giganteum]|uniref:Uncharacterized protein n=1 Tax=Lagenidium giganteum TaxID=4803 RepID=A0AAV2YWD7_9STRA|nr:TPA: hypothetical protein N0F65_009765 [Lagenidium giganteum]
MAVKPMSAQRMRHVWKPRNSRHRPTSPQDAAAPASTWRRNEFECLGWVELDTQSLRPTGRKRECWQRVHGGEAGFCHVRNRTSGQTFHVMRTTALSLKEDVRFTCHLARAFTDFRVQSDAFRHDPHVAVALTEHRGIVIAVHGGVLASAYASIRQLRAIGCRLPIELWFMDNELSRNHVVLQTLQERFGPVTLRQVFDSRIEGFFVKIHALYYSSFTHVLLLDADNFAVKDPTFLFETDAFRDYGAVFWPDFWHPGNTIFNVHAQSLLWELLGVEYVGMLEQESGQVLVDRQRHVDVLDRLMFYATAKPRLMVKLQLVWGDKDLYRLAWTKAGKAFFFNGHRLPGSIGVVQPQRRRFCGMTMAQYDLEGRDILFLHRNTIKLKGDAQHEKRFWRHVQEYVPHWRHGEDTGDALAEDLLAVVQSFDGRRLFNETSCFGVKRFQEHPLVRMARVDHVAELASMEEIIIAYAAEAFQLMNGADAEPLPDT